jgi:hypothetical protein
MAFLLYALIAGVTCAVVHRFVRRVSWPALLVLFAVPLGIVGYALVTDSVYGPIDFLYQDQPHKAFAAHYGIPASARNASAIDVFSEFFPWRRAVQDSFARGEWPLWNPYNLCGHPLAAEAQSAPYSPFTIVALVLPAAVSMTFTTAIALFLAALSAFLFARELECSEAASLVAGIGWGLGASNVVYSQTAMGFTTIYLPLILLGVRRVVREPRVASGVLLMIALVLTVLAGHPESLFLNVLVGCIYALYELAHVTHKVRAIVAASVAGIMAALVCAVFLLPLLEAIPQSMEYESKRFVLGERPRGVARAQFLMALATDVFPHLHVRRFLKPDVGYIGAETAAVGSIVLALALYAVWRRRSSDTWFFTALGIFCVLCGARWAPLSDLLKEIPLLNITLYDRLAFAAALCLCVLAALGVEEMIRRRDFRVAALSLAVVLVLLAIGTWWVSQAIVLDRVAADYGHARPYAELGFLTLAVALLAWRPRFVIPALLVILFAQRVLSEWETFRTFDAEAAFPKIAMLAPLEKIREPFRLVGHHTAFPPATNTFYGLEDPRGYEALTLKQLVRTWAIWAYPHGSWYHRVDDLEAPFLSFLNVRFAITDDTRPVPNGWKKVGAQPGAMLLENERVLPRIFVPPSVNVGGASEDEIVDRMSMVRDFSQETWITTREAITTRANGPGTIALRSRKLGGEYLFDATMQREGYVVISDSAWKGWRATIDGKRVPMFRANAAFLAVLVPAGTHEVQVVYRPRSFVIGRGVSVGALAVLVALALRSVRSARSARSAVLRTAGVPSSGRH